MLALNFLRSALALAALTGFAGIFAVAMQLYSDGPGTVPHPERATWLWLIGWALVAYLWKLLDWYLSLAPVIAAQQNCDAIAALAGAVRASGDHAGRFFGINFAFGGLHIVAFCLFAGVSLFPVMLAAAISGKALVASLCIVVLAYFAVVDFLYIARLGAYASLVADRSTATPGL